MKASDGLYVDTLNNKPDLTALTRSTADVLASIDFHHSTLLTAGQQQFWVDCREMRPMNDGKPQVDWAQLEKRIASLMQSIDKCDEFLRTSRWQPFTAQLNGLVSSIAP